MKDILDFEAETGNKTKETHRINSTAKWLAIISFSIGSLIFLLFLFTKNTNLVFTGLIYVILAFFINLIALVTMIISLIINPKYRKQDFISILYLLSNVPIASLYFWIVTSWL